MSEPTALTPAIHAYFDRALADERGEYGPGCVHFDKGFGGYAMCEDPDQDVPIRALPDILSAAEKALREAVENLLAQPVFVGDEGFEPTLVAVSAGHLAALRSALTATTEK